MQQKSFGLGDTLILKKNHACSKNAKEFKVLRMGSDIRMVCLSCGHDITLQRVKLEKNIKSVIPNTQPESSNV